jgi:RHS repeat-associated protein
VNDQMTYNADNDVTEIINVTYTYVGSHRGFETEQPESATFNTAGQLESQQDNGGASTNTYTYDDDGQLTNSGDGFTATYSYDLNGNRNSTGYTTGAGNELTNSPGVTYTYDNDGNIISATTTSGTTTYTYDYANRITSVDQYGTVIATYTYDALGRRIETDDSGTKTWTVYNGTSADADPYADFTGSGAVSERYLFGPAATSNAILARTSASGTTDWYETDQLGSVENIVNTSGTIVDAIVYDPFGNIVSESSPTSGDRFKFAGMQYDSTTGLYYDHARYYDAAIGRFVSQDPMGFSAGDTNLYRYVDNEPTDAVDLSGLDLSTRKDLRQGTSTVSLLQPDEQPENLFDPHPFLPFIFPFGPRRRRVLPRGPGMNQKKPPIPELPANPPDPFEDPKP